MSWENFMPFGGLNVFSNTCSNCTDSPTLMKLLFISWIEMPIHLAKVLVQAKLWTRNETTGTAHSILSNQSKEIRAKFHEDKQIFMTKIADATRRFSPFCLEGMLELGINGMSLLWLGAFQIFVDGLEWWYSWTISDSLVQVRVEEKKWFRRNWQQHADLWCEPSGHKHPCGVASSCYYTEQIFFFPNVIITANEVCDQSIWICPLL